MRPTRRGTGLGQGQEEEVAESRFWWWWLILKGISTVRKRSQQNRAYVIKKTCVEEVRSAYFWTETRPNPRDGIFRVDGDVCHESLRQVDWWALGGNRGKDDDQSDTFGCVNLELAHS